MMPIRQANADNKQQIYRNFEIGKLLKLIMLDTRVIGRDIQNTTDASVQPTPHVLSAADLFAAGSAPPTLSCMVCIICANAVFNMRTCSITLWRT